MTRTQRHHLITRQQCTELVEKIKKANSEYTMKELCELFQLAQSSFYYQPKGLTAVQEKMIVEIKSIANETNDQQF